MQVTYVYQNGQCVGRSLYDQASGRGLSVDGCVDKKPAAPAPVSAEPSVWRQIGDTLLSGLFMPVPSPLGCADEPGGPTVDDLLQDGGIPLNPPDTDGAGGETADSGAIFTDAGVILPVDDGGNPILPDDIWFDIEGQGSFFQETPDILFESGYISGAGLQDLTLRITLGSDSTLVPGMPAEGCFPGMVDQTPANEEAFCPDPGYTSFATCPGEEAKRLKVYIGGYTVEGYKFEAGEYTKIGETPVTLTTAAQLFIDPSTGTGLGVVCGDSPIPFSIDVPAEYYSDGALFLKFKLNLIVDARQCSGAASYRTSVQVKVQD